jgi:hypothetical protein
MSEFKWEKGCRLQGAGRNTKKQITSTKQIANSTSEAKSNLYPQNRIAILFPQKITKKNGDLIATL